MNKTTKIASLSTLLLSAVTAAFALYLSSKAPDPLRLPEKKPFQTWQVAEEYQERFAEPFTFATLSGAPLEIKLTQGDRIIVYTEEEDSTSYFVESQKPQTHSQEKLESIIAKKLGKAAVRIDVHHSREIETAPLTEITLAPQGYDDFATKLRHGWRIFRQPESEEQKPDDFFSNPGSVHHPANPQDYPYSFSPAIEGIEYEYSFLQNFDQQRILWFFDNLANSTARKLMQGAKSENLPETLRRYRATLRGKGEIAKAIASSLRDAKIIYHPEGLWNRAFDPRVHQGDIFHLDCDLLSYAFLHVAYRLDLPIRAVSAPNHLYVQWQDAEHLFAIETTEFRTTEIKGNIIDKEGRDLGEHFFPSNDYFKEKYRIDPSLQRHARFFEAIQDAELRVAVRTGTISALYKQAMKETKDQGLTDQVRKEMEKLSRVSDNPQLFTNLYLSHTYEADAAFREGRYQTAKDNLDKAIKIFETHSDRLIFNSAGDTYELRAQVSKKLGKPRSALADYQRAIQWYERIGVTSMTQGAVQGEAHARARFYMGIEHYQRGEVATAYNQYLAFTLNYLLNNTAKDQKLYETFIIAAEVFREQDPRMSREMDRQAREHGF